MDYVTLSNPSFAGDIVGRQSDENPHKKARFESLFGSGTATREQSGWTSDPIVSSEDNAQTAPSTVAVFSATDPCKDPKAVRHNVYPVHVNTALKTATPDFSIPLKLTTEKTLWKFGVLLTTAESDGTALVSLQWHFKSEDALPFSHPWPGVLMEWQKNHGLESGYLCTFAAQHATVVQLGPDAAHWTPGQTLYVDTTIVNRKLSEEEKQTITDAATQLRDSYTRLKTESVLREFTETLDNLTQKIKNSDTLNEADFRVVLKEYFYETGDKALDEQYIRRWLVGVNYAQTADKLKSSFKTATEYRSRALTAGEARFRQTIRNKVHLLPEQLELNSGGKEKGLLAQIKEKDSKLKAAEDDYEKAMNLFDAAVTESSD